MGILSEYIAKLDAGKLNVQDELQELIKVYNNQTGEYLLIYATVFNRNIPEAMMLMDDYYIIHDLLHNVSNKHLSCYIESPGGSGETAEEIAEYFHNKFDRVSYIISGEAKSAGTILVLSGHEIFMTETGSLGPIDAQIRIGRSTVSAYDYVEWIKNAKIEAAKLGRLNPVDATIIAQVNPGEYQGVYISLNYAIDLIKAWLPIYKFRDWETHSSTGELVTDAHKEERAKEIADFLVNHTDLRTHGRSLKRTDLSDMLKIHDLDQDKKLSDIIYRIQALLKLMWSTSANYKIFMTADEKIFQVAASANLGAPILPTKIPHVININMKCDKCGKEYKYYGKFSENPQVDIDMKNQGIPNIKEAKAFKCSCDNMIFTEKTMKEIETKLGRKFV